MLYDSHCHLDHASFDGDRGDVHRPGLRAVVEARVPAEVLVEIASYGAAGFVPLEVDVVMGTAVLETLGRDEALRFWTRYVTHHLDSPLLAGFVRTAFTLFGTTPGSLAKWMPKGLSLIFRDAFEVTVVAIEPTRAVVRFDVTSEVFATAPVYGVVVESFFLAIFEATRRKGRVKVVREPRTITLDASWT